MARIDAASMHFDLVCFSHLRWDFVFQRPQHLLTRFAAGCRVFYVEEPEVDEGGLAELEIRQDAGVTVVTPHLPARLQSEPERNAAMTRLVDDFFVRHAVERFVLWYYTPMALAFSRHLSAQAVVFDCMDELSAFAAAPPELRSLETELLRRADVVFTGGQSLYEAKRSAHRNVHAVPSSVDVAHFAQARLATAEPEDQALIAHPRIGYFGVIDERMDLELLAAVADARPDWNIVMIGPVVKIDPDSLPRRANIHYLGPKTYAELPGYIASWNVALMPFARNEATRFISPTKTPEYLAAGKPVVSTSIRDVVRPYGKRGLVRIADDAPGFVDACEAAMEEEPSSRISKADAFLKTMSWDRTWERMSGLLAVALQQRERRAPSRELTPASTSVTTASGVLSA
jgi:glycosyltransferase involved in cell wall biosynthesis